MCNRLTFAGNSHLGHIIYKSRCILCNQFQTVGRSNRRNKKYRCKPFLIHKPFILHRFLRRQVEHKRTIKPAFCRRFEDLEIREILAKPRKTSEA